jgi:hypothetical protein
LFEIIVASGYDKARKSGRGAENRMKRKKALYVPV